MTDFTFRPNGNVEPDVRAAAIRALFEGAEHLLDESRRLVPLEEGILSGSGHTEVDEDALEAYVIYDTPYAVRQHEDTTLAHNAGRQAKYLEQPVRERGPDVTEYIADRIRAVLR